ncbi:hypothetical protein AYO22_09531 [Fonsecaea multimorphosa]|nr:hypothetical protein AYO22_09531 [Fonsecaea multimorphosa]
MRKSSSGRHRAGSEASARPERPRNDDQDSPKGRSAADAMTTPSSRRKSSRRDNYEETDITYATTITEEPSQISDRYRNDLRKDSEPSDTRKRSSRTDKRTKYEKSRGNEEDNDSRRPRKEDSPRDSRKSSKSSGKESARVYQNNSASLPENQFPGEVPSTYSQPYRPPGLAAEYYGDNGESVAFQPGVRPNAPNIVTSAEQAHLLEPTIEAKPPPEPSSMGQVGAAASYFDNASYDGDVGSQTTPSKPPQKLNLGSNKPSKHSYYGVSPRTSPVPQGNHAPFGHAPGTIGSFPASGTAAMGLAAEYYAGGGAGGAGGGGSSSSAYQTPNRPSLGAQMASTPYSAPAGIGGSHQYSNAALYGGAAALAGAAAGAYVSGHHHHPPSSGQHQDSTNAAGLAHGYPASQGTQMHHAHRHKHQGLFGRFIDWWRDPEAVARFEEYTETIGVCKYCFDPMSSPADAPRRHDYRRRRPSPGSRHGSTTRVDKMYRYSSDENLRKHSSVKKKMVVGGLAGYGAAKLGEAMVKQKHDFDDTYPVRAGRPADQSRVSFQEEHQLRRYDDEKFERPHSRQGAGRRKTSLAQRGHRARRSSSSSSSSRSHAMSRGAALSAGVGAAGVALGSAALGAEHRRRSKSRSRSPSSRRKYFSKRVSPMHSYVDLSTTNQGTGGLMSFFTSPSANSRKGKKPKGLFNFSNASSSSSDADLRFGEGTVRRTISQKRLRERERQGKQHRNNPVAAMEDLVITGTALAGEANRREQKGRRKQEADKYTGPAGRHADGRRISMADHETSGGQDDEWYDTDGGGDSESSVDTAMAYGGGFSASQSREHLTQGGQPSVSGYNFREDDQRQYQNSLGRANLGHAPSFPISSVETAALASAGGALGGWMASNALSQESNPPPTYSPLDPMRKLEPRPISDPPSKATSPQTTRVSSTSVPLYQPQPMVPVAPFIDNNISEGTQSERQTRWKGQRASSPVAGDSIPAKLPSQGTKSSVNFNLTDEQREKEERANGRDRRGRGSIGDNDPRRLADATVSLESTQKPPEPLRDQTAPRPKRSSDADGSSFDADKRVAEIDRELERLYQEHQKAEERKRKESSQKRAVEGAVAGAAAAVAVDSIASKDNKSRSREEATPTRKSSLKKSREKDPSSSPETQQERIARMAAQRVRSTPSPVQHNDYSAFFVPTEIREHLQEHNDKAEHRDDFGATLVEIIPGAPKPRSSHPFDPFTYRQFGLELDDDPLLHPWPVPILGLIEPTPPGSQVHSVAGDETPIIEPKSKEPSEDIGEPLERRESKVTWGDHDTYVYEVVTPEYERPDYGPDSGFQGQQNADIPTPDEVTEEAISNTEETQQRPGVGRAWTLDEKEAEKLEKEVPVVDDRPQISRAWTINDTEAEEIAQELPERQPAEDPLGIVHHGVEEESNPQEAKSASLNGGPEGRRGGSLPAETAESNPQKAFYQSPFAETVSDLGLIGSYPTTVPPEAKSRTVLALEDGGERSGNDLREKDNTSSTVRPSKSDRRRRERSRSSVDASLPSPAQQVPSELVEDTTPRQLLRTTDGDRNLEKTSGATDFPALGLGLGTSVFFTADQVVKDNARNDDTGLASGGQYESSRSEVLPTNSDPKSQGRRSGVNGEYHSDPEEWERLREKPKRSKTGSKSDVGEKTPRNSKNRRTAESTDFEPLRRSRTDDDLYGNERSRRSSRHSNGDLGEESIKGGSNKGEERTSRERHRKPSDGYYEGDNRSVASSAPDSRTKKESGGFFSNLFSSNKSDVSTSSKKSSKSSKSDSRANRERYDEKESRRKRRSKDKAEFDDTASAVSEPSRRDRRSPDRQTVHIDPKEASNDQTVDDGFVSAEEIAGTPIKDNADQQSFLGSRPEMPQPMDTDMPMGTDGVSGPRSERETSSPPGITNSIQTEAAIIPTDGKHIAAPLAALMAGDHSETLPDGPAPGVVEEVQSPEEGSPAPISQSAASRRLSAIRTGDIPSGPMAASSPTAVPLHFRRPPLSPTNPRFSMSSPVMSPSSPLTTPRTRQGRPKSTEFRSSKEFRPLYLVERQNYAKTVTTELAEEYPSLPSSKTSSAHPSMEDLRAEAHLQDQAESFTPSRISAEIFRERGRRHSSSYWNDVEERRESPDYLDSRSATPVPGEAQRARDQEKKSKPKYEFHSPSELLQDPHLFHGEAQVDEQFGPHSPLPSVASTDADQDYMSARSRSLSPTGTRSRSRSRRSTSTPRTTSAAWQDGIPSAAAGAVVGSALAVAAHRALKDSQENMPEGEAETPMKARPYAEELNDVAPAAEPKAVNVARRRDETASQPPTGHESVQATIDMHQNTNSHIPTKATLGSDAWRDVFAEIHRRRLDPDILVDASTAANTEELRTESLQQSAVNELVSPSNIESMVPVQSVDGLLSNPSEVVGRSIVGPEKVETLEEESGLANKATLPALSSAAEPSDPVPGLEEQAEPVQDSQQGLELQMESVKEATGPSDELKRSQHTEDKDKEDARLTSDEASPPMLQSNKEHTGVLPQHTEPEDGFASGIQGVEDVASGNDEPFEDATDMQPTEATPALEFETPSQPEPAHSVDVDEQIVAAGDAAPEPSLAEDELSITAQLSQDPLEEAFKQAMEARGLTAGATVEAAYQAFQPEIPDVGGTQLSTIREEGEASSPSGEQISGSIDREGVIGRSKKEKRKQKRAKKASTLDDPVEPDSTPVETDSSLQPAMEERQDVEPVEPVGPILSEEVTKEPTPIGEAPNPFGNDFEINRDEPDMPSMSQDDRSVLTSKKFRKGKEEKKKQSQLFNWNETEMSVDQTEPGEAAQAAELELQQPLTATGFSNERELPALEGHAAPEISVGSADTAQQESDYATEISSKSGKKKKSKKKKGLPITIEDITGQVFEESSAVEVPRAAPESFAPQADDVTSAVASIDSSGPISGPEVAKDQAPRISDAKDTQLDASMQKEESGKGQTLDAHTAVDSVETEVPLAKQQLPEDSGQTPVEALEAAGTLVPKDATAPVNAVGPEAETKQEMRALDSSVVSRSEASVAQDEGVAKHLELEFEATSAVGDGERVQDKQDISAPTPPAVAEDDRMEERPATSTHDESLANAQPPTDETPPGDPITPQDDDTWAFDEIQKAMSAREAPSPDESGAKEVFSEANRDTKDTEDVPTAPELSGALAREDPSLVEEEPRQNEDVFPITTKKLKKDKKKKRASAFEGSEMPSSVQDGEIADIITNSSVPEDGSMAEELTTQRLAEVQPEAKPAFSGEGSQDVGEISSSKKKSKKSKAKKQRQPLLDDVAGSADDVGAENEKQFQSIMPTTSAAHIEGADTVTPWDERTGEAKDLWPAEGKVSPNVEDLNLAAAQQQPMTVLTSEVADNTDAAPEPSDSSIEHHAGSRASLDFPEERPPAPESGLDKLSDEGIRSVKIMEAEANIHDSFAYDAAATETAIAGNTRTTIPAESPAIENSPSEIAVLVPPVQPTAELAPEPTTDPAKGSALEPTAELPPEPTTDPATEPTSESVVEYPSEPATEPAIEHTVEPAIEPTVEPTVEPTTEPSDGTAIEAPVKTSTELTGVSLSEANIETPIEAVPHATVEPADGAGVKASNEAAVEPASSRELPPGTDEFEPVTEEDLSLSSKRSKKEKKSKKSKRQSTLMAEATQSSPLPSENQTVTDEPEPELDESTGANINKSISPPGDRQGAAAMTGDIDEENMASMYVVAKKDKKKKKRQSNQVPEAPQLKTLTESSDKSNFESETTPESRTIETRTDESGPASEPMTLSAPEAARPEGDALTVEGDFENIGQEDLEADWQEELTPMSTKSKRDKKKKKRQSNIEFATPEAAFENSREEASQPTTGNMAGPFTNDGTQTLETVEALATENDLPTPGDQAEEWWAPADKKRKNRKKGQNFKLNEASLPQDSEPVRPHEGPYIESRIDNGIREQDVNLPEKEPMSKAVTQQDSAPAGAGEMAADNLSPEESTSIQLEELDHQPEAADNAEESDKVQKVSRQDNTDLEKPVEGKLVAVEPVQNAAQLLDERDVRAEPLNRTPEEDPTTSGIDETASMDPVFEQATLSRKKLKKGKKKASQSAFQSNEEQEPVETAMGEDDSSLGPPEAVQPVAEKEWPTLKTKNGERNNQQLALDDSGAELGASTPEVESVNVEGLDKATTQALPAVSDALGAIPDQGPRIDEFTVSKKNGKKKKKRQPTFADVEELPVSVEASASPTPITNSEHSEEKPSFSAIEGEVASAPQTEDLGEDHRFDSAALNTESKTIGDAERQDEVSMDALPIQEHAVMEGQDSVGTTAEEVHKVAPADIQAGGIEKFQSNRHSVADVLTTTLSGEKRADVASGGPDSLAASGVRGIPVLAEEVDEAPMTADTDCAHVKESSTLVAPVSIESSQAHITEENLPEMLIATPATHSQFDQLAGPDTAKPLRVETLQFHEELPPESSTAPPAGRAEVEVIPTTDVRSGTTKVNKGIDDILEEDDSFTRPKKKKTKKQWQSTYEEPVSDPQQFEDTEAEAIAKGAEAGPVFEPAAINPPKQVPTAVQTNDTVAKEEIASSSAKAKKDKKRKSKILPVEDEVNAPQSTIQDDLEPVEVATPSEFQPEKEAVARSIDATILELDHEHDVAKEATEALTAERLTTVEPTENVSHGSPSRIPEVMQTSPSAADDTGVPEETSFSSEFRPEMPEGTIESKREDAPTVEEPDAVWSDLPKAKKSQKEKRKSKRKSAFEEEAKTDDLDGPRAENEIDTRRDDVPPNSVKSSQAAEVQPESEWGFSSKKTKKKSKNSKAFTATGDFGTSGTATPYSNGEFASAVQTPIQQTGSPEPMEDVNAEQTSVPAPEAESADYFAPAPSKKKSKKDKQRKSFLAWTGNEDQTAEDASGTSTPAPFTEPEISRTAESLEMGAVAAELEKDNAKRKPEVPDLPLESHETKTGDNLQSTVSVVDQEALHPEDYTNIAADTHGSTVSSAERAPGQRALDKLHDSMSTPDQPAFSSIKTSAQDDTLPHDMEPEVAQPIIRIGHRLLGTATDTAGIVSDPSKAKIGAESENDQVTPSLKEHGMFQAQDEHAGLIAADSGVPEATDHQQGVFENDNITPEGPPTDIKINEEDAMAPATSAIHKDTEGKRGLDETDFSTIKDTSKRKKSKKGKKGKTKSGIFDGAEDIEPQTELDRTEIREPGVAEAVHFEGMEISGSREQPPENADNLSDVSETTRDRRKRRRSPPAWTGEEPEDLPRDHALTPPPEHDDIMDTALGVAAGLGFGAGETESTRESSRKVPSPVRQPSAGWSFAKLDPITKLTDADTNRDSGVQFESPTLSSGDFTSQRDSGYVPSPTIQHGEFRSTRDSNADMNLRPPRPQSPTSSTEDVSETVASRKHVDQSASLETPRRKPSPVESTSKDRSSVLFNSSPAILSPLNTDIRSRSPQAISSPLRRSPSIHGHHHSREELRQQKAKIPPHHEDSDQLASNLIDRSAAAPVDRSAFDSHWHTNINRPYSPGKTTLKAINEDAHEPTSQAHPFSDPPAPLTPRHSAENNSLAAAGLVAAAGAAAFAATTIASRDSPAPGAKALGRSKSRTSSLRNLRSASISPYDPANFASESSQGPANAQIAGKAAARDREMAEVYDGYGSYPGSPRSPTRPPSIRQRQSMQQIRDLEAKVDQLASENRSLAEAKIVTEQQLEQAHFERNRTENSTVAFNAQIQERDAEITRLKQEVASLIATHDSLKKEHEQTLIGLRQNYDEAQSQWQDSLQELEALRSRHNELSTGMESIVKHEIDTALSEKNAEIQRLQGDLEAAREKIRELQSQILSRGADDVVVFHDEDYFDQACQKLCQQVQGWVLRFSKSSDLKLCRTTNEVRDEKIVDRFDNAILDGSDVDVYLADRVKRRDVFMSVVMTMIWEYVFTRYLFGMDRDQRQKLKQLEKNLGEVRAQSAVHQWRALTLTLLSKRESFKAHRESDTEAVAIEIFSTLSRFLPPPQHLEEQIVGSLRNVMRTAVELSIEMRTQRAEYIMLPPLQPEYDTNGDLARKVYFNASLMNERSGETTSNEELERERAVVRMVLFPLVVKKGDDNGVGDEEIVVCPAQVLIARPDKLKRVKSSTRHASGGSDAKSLRAVSTHSLAMSGIEGNENMF